MVEFKSAFVELGFLILAIAVFIGYLEFRYWRQKQEDKDDG